MVVMHIVDRRGAAQYGLKTVYVRRPDSSEPIAEHDLVESKANGVEVSLVDSLVQLAVELGGGA